MPSCPEHVYYQFHGSHRYWKVLSFTQQRNTRGHHIYSNWQMMRKMSGYRGYHRGQDDVGMSREGFNMHSCICQFLRHCQVLMSVCVQGLKQKKKKVTISPPPDTSDTLLAYMNICISLINCQFRLQILHLMFSYSCRASSLCHTPIPFANSSFRSPLISSRASLHVCLQGSSVGSLLGQALLSGQLHCQDTKCTQRGALQTGPLSLESCLV